MPATLPVFPVAGALLLPRRPIQLTVFEPRYLEMLDDALTRRAADRHDPAERRRRGAGAARRNSARSAAPAGSSNSPKSATAAVF